MRKDVPKKIKFEVLKRDKFTCQYCGAKAPDVLLHVDHINPYSKSKDNSIINLITSCQSCNLGKGDRTLDDDSVIVKQINQMEELQERRNQLEELLMWRESLLDIENDEISSIINYCNKVYHPCTLTETGEVNMKKYIKKYKSLLVIEAIDESKKYFEYDNTKSDTQNMSYAFSQIEKILKYKSKPPVEQKISYCLGIIRNKFYNSDLQHYGWLIERVVENIEGHLSYTEEEVVQWFDDSLIPF
jgi:hypothetical protein